MASAKSIKAEQQEDQAKSLAIAAQGRRGRRRQTWTAALLSMGTRLAIWYALVTAIFFCPASFDELKTDSSHVCKPYLHVKSYATPHVAPYYQAYAAPYVDAARPYAAKIHAHVYQPTFAYAKLGYERYGAPRIAQIQRHGQEEWGRVISPSIEKVQALIQDRYDASLGTYVNHINSVVSPYYDTARVTAVDQYQNTVLPTYNKARPYAASAYAHLYVVVTDIVLPYLQKSGEFILTTFTRRIWPPIRVLYGENVQPQLLKIRERLTNYRDARAIESAMENTVLQSSKTAAFHTESSAPSSTDAPQDPSGTAIPDPESTAFPLKMSLSSELQDWKAKFAKASRKGIEDLKIHIAELTKSQIETQAEGTGLALVVQLEDITERSLKSLQNGIISVVASLPEQESDEDEQRAIDASQEKVRSAGRNIKEVAQKLRTWKVSYLDKTEDLVRDATDNTLDVIDHIRELGLQEIGMRYAHEEDATHQEWREYHALKKTFDTWRNDIDNAGKNHAGLAKAKQAGEDVESQGMAVAEHAAKELARLKNVALWKIRAKDTSDDFSTRPIPAAISRAQEIVAEKVVDLSEAILGTSEGAADSISSIAADSASSFTDAAWTTAVDLADAIPSGVSSAAILASSSASELQSAAFENLPIQMSQAGDEVQSSMSTATVYIGHVASSISETVASLAETGVSSAASINSMLAESASTRASGAAKSEASSPLSEASDTIASVASAASNRVVSASSSIAIEPSSPSLDGSQSLASATSQASEIIRSSDFPLSSTVREAVVDSVQSASSSIASLIAEAGDEYADLTTSLVSSASDMSSGAGRSVSSAISKVTSASAQVDRSVSSVASQISKHQAKE